MDDPEYSTPGDDNQMMSKASFALDNSKMLDRIKKNKKIESGEAHIDDKRKKKRRF